MFGMDPRIIRLPHSAATPNALDNSLELAFTNQDRLPASQHLYNAILKMR
jgi:hypothetical protein